MYSITAKKPSTSNSKLNKKHGYYHVQPNYNYVSEGRKRLSESIVRMDGSFYTPATGNTKFIRHVSSHIGNSKGMKIRYEFVPSTFYYWGKLSN